MDWYGKDCLNCMRVLAIHTPDIVSSPGPQRATLIKLGIGPGEEATPDIYVAIRFS